MMTGGSILVGTPLTGDHDAYMVRRHFEPSLWLGGMVKDYYRSSSKDYIGRITFLYKYIWYIYINRHTNYLHIENCFYVLFFH